MKKLYFLALSIFASASLMATQVQVKAGDDLQAAVNAANSGDTVLVQAGTYEGNFTMKDGVYVSGGWNEDFTAQTEHASILDAKADGRVLNQPNDFTTLTIWDNFTIQNGKLTEYLDKLGAGVALLKNGRVINCLVQNNTFTYTGKECAGGGIANNSGGDTCAINCVVRNNKGTHGGGIRTAGIALNCLVENNEATGNGGGVYLHWKGELHNSIVRKNVSKDVGGVDLAATACAIYNCLVADNHANGVVGGIQVRNGSSVVGCTVVRNNHNTTDPTRVTWGAIRVNSGNSDDYANHQFTNNVVWGNTHNDTIFAEQIMPHTKRYPVRTNNALQGSMDIEVEYIALAIDNMAADGPQFNEDYSFAWSSPLYNAGNNDALAKILGDKDVYGNARKQGANIEIGAVEHTEYKATVATIENGSLTLEFLGQQLELVAGEYSLPEGFTATVVATPAEGYVLDKITIDQIALEAEEGVYTLPAVKSDFVLAATFVKQSTPTGVENTTNAAQVIAIYDMLGRQVYNQVNDLATGMYIVVTSEGTQKISIK